MENESDSWHGGISDLMTGLMIIFLLIAVSYMLITEKATAEIKRNNTEIRKETAKVMASGRVIKEIVATYNELQVGLYKDLLEEFRDDLMQWGATLEKDSTVRFNEPDILFETGEAKIKDNFKTILDDFFPRYLKVISSEKYKKDIEEIRIEGHTSSDWENAANKLEIYLNNAELSQQRAYAVLAYCYRLDKIFPLHDWLNGIIRANGFSHGIPVRDANNREDKARSRRVEFRVVTKSQKRILKIVEEIESI